MVQGPSDSLTVNQAPPGFSKAFQTDPIAVGGTSKLIFTIDNTGGGTPATNLAFTDTLPPPVDVASPNNAATTCGGIVSIIGGTQGIMFSGGTVSAGQSCTVSVDTTSSVVGTHTNTSSDLQSTVGSVPVRPPATDTLTVEPPPTFAKFFNPASIVVNATSTLTFTIDNTGSALPATGLDFTDSLPPGS